MSKYCLTKNQQVDLNNPKGWISVLFQRLANRYSYAFLSHIPTRETELEQKAEWVEVLKDVPLLRMKIALDRCCEPGSKFLTYPPTSMEFLALCQLSAEELNIPSLEESFKAVMTHQTKDNDFLLGIMKFLDIYNFRLQPEKEAFKRFKPLYEIAKAQALREGKILSKIKMFSDFQPQTRKITEEEKQNIDDHEASKARVATDRMREILGQPQKYLTAMEVRLQAMAAEDKRILRGESF